MLEIPKIKNSPTIRISTDWIENEDEIRERQEEYMMIQNHKKYVRERTLGVRMHHKTSLMKRDLSIGS